MQHFFAESDDMTVGRICGKSSLYTILLADAATNSGFFYGKLAASARRKPCSGILPQMRPVGGRGWEDVVWENGIITIVISR